MRACLTENGVCRHEIVCSSPNPCAVPTFRESRPSSSPVSVLARAPPGGMPSQGSYTPTRQLEDDTGPYVTPGDSAYVAELHNSVQQLQGAATVLRGDAAPVCGPELLVLTAHCEPQLCTRTRVGPPGTRPYHVVSVSARLTPSAPRPLSVDTTAELAAEKQRAKDIIVQLKREVEQVLNESEASAQEAREASAQLLAAAQAEAGRQRDNVDWLQNALERAEERVRALEQTALSSGNVEERVASAVAKARAPLELRTEGLAVRE